MTRGRLDGPLVLASVRTGHVRSAVALVAMTIWFATDLAPAGQAVTPSKATRSVAQVSRSRLARGAFGTVALNMDEVQLSIDVTTKELRSATDLNSRLDRDLLLASQATTELREETTVVAQQTLKNAIDGYQHSELRQDLLGAQDLTSSLRATALGGAAVSSDTESFDAYRNLRKDLEIEEAELADRTARATASDNEVARLEDELAAVLAVYGELEERRLQDQAAVVTSQAFNRAQARGRKQGFYLDTCPVNGSHSFIDSWGFARSGGRRHKGVDILAANGVELVAPVSGRVEHFSNSVGGRSFRLFGENGNYFYGTHMSGFGKSGDVRAGEVIGYVGDDGNAAGTNHLHFEIHPGGRGNPINPFIDTAAVCSGVEY